MFSFLKKLFSSQETDDLRLRLDAVKAQLTKDASDLVLCRILVEEYQKENLSLQKAHNAHLLELKIHKFSKGENATLIRESKVFSLYLENAIVSLVNTLYMSDNTSQIPSLLGGIKAI